MSIETELNTVVTTVENDAKVIFKDVETALTTDIGPATTATKSAIGGLLTKKIDVFGATVPLNKKVTKKVVELVAIAALAVGLIGTQLYVYMDHKSAIELNSARVGSVEAYNKQTDTNFVNVNAEITTTNKIVASVQTEQKATDAKVAALAAQVSSLNGKLSPVHSLTARKYYRKR